MLKVGDNRNTQWFLDNQYIPKRVELACFKTADDAYKGVHDKRTLEAEYQEEDFTVVAIHKTGSPIFAGSPKLTEQVKSEIASLEKQYYSVMDARGAFASW